MLNAGHVGTRTSAGPILAGLAGHDVAGDSLQLSHVVEAPCRRSIKGVAGLLGHLCCLVGAEGGGGLAPLGGCLWALC